MNTFRNMKIRTKLVLGFSLTALLAAIVGVLGIIGLYILSENEIQLYEDHMNALYWAEELEITLDQQRIAYRDLYINWDDPVHYDKAVAELGSARDYFENTALPAFGAITGTDSTGYLNIRNDYDNLYIPLLNEYLAAVGRIEAQGPEEVLQMLDDMPQTISVIEGDIEEVVSDITQLAEKTQADDTSMANRLMLILAVVAVFSAAMGVFLAFFNAGMIAKPTLKLVEAARSISEGDVDISLDIDSKDEIGVLAGAFAEMAQGFQEQARTLNAMGSGDYSVTSTIRSEKDVVGKAIAQVLENSNQMLAEIRTASSQVSSGSEQIAQGAQSLATGSSEQAATLEQLSAAITEVLSQSEANTKKAEETVNDTQKAGELMGESMASMQRMTEAMQQINDSSQSISRVIKVIDDIAFQTNILALNAAVEAARAGQHGKGFAVVADEVRNLAGKSAEAASETASLIESSVAKVTEGNQIVVDTHKSLSAMAEIAASNAESMKVIGEASQRQSLSIAEVTQGITQISSVVQENSATAEESAASAEEMSAQAQLLEQIVARFKLKDGGLQFTLPQEAAGGYSYSAPAGSYDDTGFSMKYGM